jgi:hypothetical protein
MTDAELPKEAVALIAAEFARIRNAALDEAAKAARERAQNFAHEAKLVLLSVGDEIEALKTKEL